MENNESFASPKEETPASKEKPDFEEAAENFAGEMIWINKGYDNEQEFYEYISKQSYKKSAESVWNDHVEPAKAWSEKQNAFIEKLSQENESHREQIAALQEEIRQLKNKQ